MNILAPIKFGFGGVLVFAPLFFAFEIAFESVLSALLFLGVSVLVFVAIRRPPSFLICSAVLALAVAAIWAVPVYEMAFKRIVNNVSMAEHILPPVTRLQMEDKT